MGGIIFLFLGLLAGALVTWLIVRRNSGKDSEFTDEEFLSMKNARDIAEARLQEMRERNDELKTEMSRLNEKVTTLSSDSSRLGTLNEALNEKLSNQKSELENLYAQMKQQFENIAGKIVNNNAQLIQQQHSDKLNDLLNPLKEKIEKFENTVNLTHKESIRENQSLKEQLKLLQDLNKSIGEEARNLTTALKGQVKTQGNWGELILETILERSGLVKDREYLVQSSHTGEDGRRLQPDVLVKLPDNKTIIIDSKVSLIAYERYSSAETQEEKDAALKEHLASIRRHIKGLGEKNYHQLYGVNSLDFVLLFIPVEPAFAAAVQADGGLFNDAFERNIVLVSTSTLLATLRTIASIWKLEYQNKNALEIARQGGALFDKFVGFLDDFQKIGNQISSTQKSWDAAMNKLSTGKGNLINSAQKIQKLGAASNKLIPQEFLNDDSVEDSETESKPNSSGT